MSKYKYLLIVVSVFFVVGSTLSVLYLFGSDENKSSIKISSPFVESSLQPPVATPTPVPSEIPEEIEEDLSTSLPPKAGGRDDKAEEKTTKTIIINRSNDVTAELVATLQSKINTLEEKVASLEKTSHTDTSSTTTVASSDSSKVKEYYVYLGTGSTQDRDWVEISQAAAFIDTNNYGNIKSVSFEAALSIVSGNIYARLKNKTNGGIIYSSEISHNTSSSVWKQSAAFSLTNGYNEYVVEIKSSSDEKARLDGSRVKIIVE